MLLHFALIYLIILKEVEVLLHLSQGLVEELVALPRLGWDSVWEA